MNLDTIVSTTEPEVETFDDKRTKLTLVHKSQDIHVLLTPFGLNLDKGRVLYMIFKSG